MQGWTISLYDLHSIFLSTSLNPNSFNIHCCFQRNRFPAEWCMASCPPNETRKSSLSVSAGVTQWFLRSSMMSINWPPTWMEHNYLFRSLYVSVAHLGTMFEHWHLELESVRYYITLHPSQKPTLSAGTLPKGRWMLHSHGATTTAVLPEHILLHWWLSTGHLKCH